MKRLASTFLRAAAFSALTGLFACALPGCDDGVGTGDEQNATESTGRFETFKGDDGKHYFHLLAKNGERILASQGYSSISAAKKGISSVKKNGLVEWRYSVLEADSGEYYFNLLAPNGQLIGSSEMYASKANAEAGVDAVMAALENPVSAAAETSGVRFETFKGQDGKSYFRLRAANGQIVLASQGYSSKTAADSGIKSVKTNGVDPTRFDLVEGANDQYSFHLTSSNGKIIARSEMYASKSNAIRAADRVRDMLRELAGKGAPSDAEVQADLEKAAAGVLYMSESDFPFTFVSAPGQVGAPIDEALLREVFADEVNGDDAADKPMAELFAMERSWQEWKDAKHSCGDPNDTSPEALEACSKMRNLESVIESDLTDVKVFYFGANGTPGNVDGTGVSVFIVGRSASGKLVGLRTIAIWT